MNPAALRLQKEFARLKKKPRSNYFQVYDLRADNLFEWTIFLIGPPRTYYEGGIYKAIMRFPESYPMDPPSVQFECQMVHPNIYSDGKVCITTLQVPSGDASDADLYWRPVLGVEQALLSVVSLLSDPNCDDPANSEAATLFENEPKKFKKRAAALAKQSHKMVPDDFISPVIAGTLDLDRVELQRTISEMSSRGANFKVGEGDNFDADDYEEEYQYSDDEWGNEAWEEEGEEELDVVVEEKPTRKTSKSSTKSSKKSSCDRRSSLRSKEEPSKLRRSSRLSSVAAESSSKRQSSSGVKK